MGKQKPVTFLLFFLSLLLYGYVAYGLQRYETGQLLLSYTLLFALYLWICRTYTEAEVKFWYAASFLLRISLLFAVPNLSDDFYRFIWDGRLLASGHHPFFAVPSYYLEYQSNIPGITPALYDSLNSKTYFTIYPPVAQFIFWLAAKLSPDSVYGSVIVMKFILLSAEAGSIVLMRKLLKRMDLPQGNVLFYALNPLVILELTGNLHFEALMIFFLLLCIYLLSKEKLWQAALAFSLAVCTKLIPLIFLPVLVTRLGWRKSLIFYAVVGNFIILFFLPLYNPAIVNGMSESLGYYFNKFEFNASVYYLVRLLGYWIVDYNIIQTAGWMLGVVAGILIVGYSVFASRITMNQSGITTPFLKPGSEGYHTLPVDWMWILLIYFLSTTTLHPWYITTLLALSVFTPYRFTVLWTLLIFFTYAGYTPDGFRENYWITGAGYMIVIGYLIYELLWKKNQVESC